MENENFISLYDFLGRAAGGELGKEVYAKAKALKQETQIRQIKTRNYDGNIVLYKRSFLSEYFNTPHQSVSYRVDPDDKELPF